MTKWHTVTFEVWDVDKLTRLCGEYGLMKIRLKEKRMEILEEAGNRGLTKDINIQMEW